MNHLKFKIVYQMWQYLAKTNNEIPFNTLLFFVAYSYFKDSLTLRKVSHSEFLCWLSRVHFLNIFWFTGWLRRTINNNTGWAQGSYWTGVLGDWLRERTSSRRIYQHSKICTMDRQGYGLREQIMTIILTLESEAVSEQLRTCC